MSTATSVGPGESTGVDDGNEKQREISRTATAATAGAPATDATTDSTPSTGTATSEDQDILTDVLSKYRTRSKSSVYFVRGSLVLAGEALATIAENAERLKANGDLVVTLVGYVEDIGSMSYGVALAQRRTSVVMDALIGMGIPSRQIRSTVFNGEAPETVPCQTEICKTSYRRVEFAYAKPR